MKYLSKQEVIDAFNAGKVVKGCGGLWNNPREKGELINSVEEIERMYHFYCMTEGKVYEGDDTIYVHGYTSGDMF